MGVLPPMDDAAWQAAFAKYKLMQGYQLVNSHMQLADFKECSSGNRNTRNWGRLMGIVFIVPFLFFWRTGFFEGLVDEAHVVDVGRRRRGGEPRLVHDAERTGGPARCQQTVAREREPLPVGHPPAQRSRYSAWCCGRSSTSPSGRRGIQAGRLNGPGLWSRALLVLLPVQIVWGAFTAGLDAGFSYNT
ncbi:MAG: COX15/CtaA family protein [Flavobacteriales bacterium]|nr:COX15/CtaA family protein [Flavobacteriales bacterium]